MELQIGDKLYSKDEDNNLIYIRIIDVKENMVSVRYENMEADFDKSYIEDNFTKLTPDGFINFTIVNVYKDYKDVIVTVHRQKDISRGDNTPFAVCRQSITNFFAEQITGEVGKYVGVSVSRNTIPNDVPMNSILACNEVVSFETISIYMDDTLDIILSLINTSKYDAVIKRIKDGMEGLDFVGYNDTLQELLLETEFMFDFFKAFDIHRLTIKIDGEKDVLTLHDRLCIETEIGATITNEVIVPYSKDIVLEDIEKPYILLSDTSDKLYLLVYDRGKRDRNKYKELFNK